jgi:predicted ABC-type ATPase
MRARPRPRVIIIAGPNGAGKTTFAQEFLPKDAGVIRFVNADLIASGLSPLRPELATLAAGRLFLAELNRLAYAMRLKHWKAAGYRLEIVFLRLASPQIALRRIKARVKQGGHNVPPNDVLRRFERGWDNFRRVYRPLADVWAVYDNSGIAPVLVERAI